MIPHDRNRRRPALGKLVAAFFGDTDDRPPAHGVDPLHLAVSVILLETAGADDGVSDAERGHVAATLRETFHLGAHEMDRLLQLAHQERAQNPDLWRFTNQINQRCSRKQKMQLMEEIWRVIYADGTLGRHEDQIAHKLGRLLNIDHPELIQAKMKVRGRQAPE